MPGSLELLNGRFGRSLASESRIGGDRSSLRRRWRRHLIAVTVDLQIEAGDPTLFTVCADGPPLGDAVRVVDGVIFERAQADHGALGHRRIGHVTGPDGNVLANARLAGAVDALSLQGLRLDPSAIYPGDFTLESGRAAGIAWLDQPPESRPTGLFLASDEMACGFIGELQRHGLRVPQDVSVVGFDDIELVAHTSPSLTTVRQPRAQIGRVAAERMLAVLAGENDATDTILPVELVIRASTAPPPAEP